MITRTSGATRLAILIACCTIPSSRQAAEPCASLCSGMPKRRMRRNAQLSRFGNGVTEPVQRELELAGHRRDFPAQVLAVINEERIDQVVSREPRLDRPCREVADGRGGGVDDEEDNRRRAGRSSHGSQVAKARMVGQAGRNGQGAIH